MSPQGIDRTAYLHLGVLAQRAVGALVRLVKHNETENVEADLGPVLDLLVRVGSAMPEGAPAKYEELRTIRQVGAGDVDPAAMQERIREVIALAKARRAPETGEKAHEVIFWLATIQNQALSTTVL